MCNKGLYICYIILYICNVSRRMCKKLLTIAAFLEEAWGMQGLKCEEHVSVPFGSVGNFCIMLILIFYYEI
jgi:hypothetical protein